MKITEVVILAETNELQSRIIQHLEKNSVWGAWYAHDVLHIPDVYTSKQKEIDIILNHSGYRIDKYIFADENDMVESLAKGHPNYKAQQAAIHISKAKNKVKEKISKNASAGEYVKDFRKSDAPQFKGKSNKKKQQMAIAAFCDAKPSNCGPK